MKTVNFIRDDNGQRETLTFNTVKDADDFCNLLVRTGCGFTRS